MSVFKDSPFTTKSVEGAQPITSFKTNTALPVQLTQSTIKPPELVIALKDSVLALMEFAQENAAAIKFTAHKLETAIASLDLEESEEFVKSAKLEPLQVPMETVLLADSTNNWLMENVFAGVDSFQTNLTSAQDAVMLLELSWSTELALFVQVTSFTET